MFRRDPVANEDSVFLIAKEIDLYSTLDGWSRHVLQLHSHPSICFNCILVRQSSIHPSIHPSIHSSIHPSSHPAIQTFPFLSPSNQASKDARVTPTSHLSAESGKQHRPHSAPPRLDLDFINTAFQGKHRMRSWVVYSAYWGDNWCGWRHLLTKAGQS
ncbi:hypothetical protein AYX14_07041 [Cryptococcus neoformans]|nr:hypothetical protein AYX14_07041 [Cryptococcus neoformans var. grubii]